MRSRLGLVALWAVFAAASVGVGFGAAGLVGDPFTDPGGDRVTLSEVSGGDASESPATPDASASGTASPKPTTTRAGSSAAAPGGARPVIRSLTTRAGVVSGSCSRGLVTVSASPAVGWALDDVDPGPASDARVRFARTGDRDGRVEVRARCEAGTPRLTVRDDPGSDGSGGGGDDGSGSDDGGGGSGGSSGKG